MKLFTLIAVISAILFSGCSMSKDVHEQAKSLESQLSKNEKAITEKEKVFFNSKEAKDLAIYVKKENLQKYFQQAKDLNAYAKTEFSQKLIPLMEKDNSSDEQIALSYIGNINKYLREASILADKPAERLTFLKDILKNKDKYLTESKKLNSSANVSFNKFLAVAKKAQKEYPSKNNDINNRIEAIQANVKKNNEAMALILSESKKETMDLTEFAKAYDTVKNSTGFIIDDSEKQTKKVKELFHSYTKILSDMKEYYYIKIGRISWDESAEYPDETTYFYPDREISQKAFEYFDSVADQEMGSLSYGFLGGSARINTSFNPTYMSQLMINPTERLPSYDDSGDFWIENLYTKNYHKYTIIEDGKKRETGWEEVTPDYYEKNFENLGMEIVSKPYGFYDDEKIVTAAPAGMAYVGNSKYGEWKTDSSGNSFWHYYGMYSFMNDIIGAGSRYSSSDYDYYRDKRKHNTGYYGRSGEYGTYGSKTYGSKSKYSRSEFARKNKSDIEISKHRVGSSSVRNAGHASRGRGPGGGGK